MRDLDSCPPRPGFRTLGLVSLGLVAAASTVLAANGWLTVSDVSPRARPVTRFEFARWDAGRGGDLEHANPRLEMADDIRNRVLQPGMTQSQIRSRLGRPFHTDSAWSGGLASWRYELGLASRLDPTPRYLKLHFHADGRLSFSEVTGE